MIPDLEVIINEPFDAQLIKDLYQNQQDLSYAWPKARYPFFEKQWSEQFPRLSNNTSLVFKLGEQIIGHVAILVNPDEIYLCYVILHPSFRGKGLAEKMIYEAEMFCRLNYPYDELYLNVEKNNPRAKKLYEGLGYKICEETDLKFTMKKPLRPQSTPEH